MRKDNKIYEIEGLRVLLALQVAFYHIWLNKVSGGVDVFFTITGFLITLSLYKLVISEKSLNLFSFLYTLIKRLFPHILLLMTIVLILSWITFSRQRFINIFEDSIYSMLYIQNWHLSIQNDEYTSQNYNTSFYRHFWALSVQGQFYIIWWIVFCSGKFLSRKFCKDITNTLILIFTIIFFLSLTYSYIITEINQATAYYNSLARLYEFSIGALLALIINKIKVSKFTSFCLSFLGFLMIFSLGVLFDVSNSFPGLVALIPALGVAAIIVSTRQNLKFSINTLLRSKYLVVFSKYAYPFYLWHWIVLMFSQNYFNNFFITIPKMIIIFLISFLLSFFTEQFVRRSKLSLKYYFSIFFVVLILTLSISNPSKTVEYNYDGVNLHDDIPISNFIESPNHYGALVNISGKYKNNKSNNIIPNLKYVKMDIGTLYDDNCNQVKKNTEVKICEYGNLKSDLNIALVGGSHTVQWFDPLLKIAEYRNFKITTMTKLGCRFTTEKLKDSSCVKWNDNVRKLILKEKVDIVITNADISTENYPAVPKGYIESFNYLAQHNIKILGFRDTPWYKESLNNCIERNGLYSSKCIIEKKEVLGETSKWTKLKNKPNNVHYIDLTKIICSDEKCSPIQGNVLVYWDSHHLTSTYAKTLTPAIDKELLKVIKNEYQ